MGKTQKNTKKTIIALGALVVVILLLLGVHGMTREKSVEGQKTITIQVVHKDQTVRTLEIVTTREYLGEVLKEEEIAQGEDGPYGMYILTADGETADESAKEWWCLTKGGEQVNTSADQTPIQDGEQYELTLTTGY